jgi:hemerythrin-like domain-containing protein
MNDRGRHRREFLAGIAGTGALLLAEGARAAPRGHAKPGKGEDMPPTEDLMREHGVLRRLLLIYDEAARRLAGDDAVASTIDVVAGAAALVRRFVERYHEKLEEDFVLPRLEKAGKLVELSVVIRTQHAVGRQLTDAILKAAKTGKPAGGEQRRAIVAPLQSFTRMYAAHAAWEDTEVFPAYRALFTEAELDKLGERFEEEEHKLLGSGGFEGALKDVGDLEQTIGMHDLAAFTPK